MPLSMVNLCSTCICSMRPFVTAIQQMTLRCGKKAHKSKATPLVFFAYYKKWRAALVSVAYPKSSEYVYTS